MMLFSLAMWHWARNNLLSALHSPLQLLQRFQMYRFIQLRHNMTRKLAPTTWEGTYVSNMQSENGTSQQNAFSGTTIQSNCLDN